MSVLSLLQEKEILKLSLNFLTQNFAVVILFLESNPSFFGNGSDNILAAKKWYSSGR